MKTIMITGRQGSGKSTLGQKRYDEYKAKNVRVKFDDEVSFGVFQNYSGSAPPDVLIKTRIEPTDLKETSNG